MNFNSEIHPENSNKESLERKIDNGIKKFKKTIKYIGIPLILLLLFNAFTFTVREDEVAVVRKFGKPIKIIVDKNNTLAEEQREFDDEFKGVEIVRDKGLFFGIPFVTYTTVDKDTSKLLTYTSTSEKVNTKDKRQFFVTFFAQYEITHPGLYQVSMGSESKANRLLDDLIFPIVIKRINQMASEPFLTEKDKLYATLGDGIEEINAIVDSYGIELTDIEIHRTLLPASNIQSTYDKMIAEREAVAEEIKATGKEAYDKTVAEVDKEVIETKAEAIEESESIRGAADAEALEIYANAYSVDPEFYEFWRTIQAYEKAIDENTTIYMDKNNEFLKYFTGK